MPNKAPVLLIIWRRPDLTRLALDSIAKYDPPRLYVSADGPRPGDTQEAALCNESRGQVEHYQGSARVFRNFMEDNHRARGAITIALEWFFQNETQGIILEDDSIPIPDFFWFCEELLEKYRNDRRVFQIAGTNHLKGEFQPPESYYFSRHQHIWGFATWRRSWESFKAFADLDDQERLRKIRLIEEPTSLQRIWKNRVAGESSGADDNWDSTWNAAAKIQGGLSATPANPLVSNLGFDSRALHSSRAPLIAGGAPTAETLVFPLVHPADVSQNFPVADAFTARVQWSHQPFPLRLVLAGLEWIRRRAGWLRGNEKTVAEIFWARVEKRFDNAK